MKASDNVIYRCIAGEHILVPVGNAAMNNNGLIVLNEIGAEIWAMLGEETTQEKIVDHIMELYDVDRATAEADTAEFLNTLRGRDLLE